MEITFDILAKSFVLSFERIQYCGKSMFRVNALWFELDEREVNVQSHLKLPGMELKKKEEKKTAVFGQNISFWISHLFQI